MRRFFVLGTVIALAAMAATGTGAGAAGGSGGSGKSTVIVFNGEGNNLNAYEAKPPFKKQTVIQNHEEDPNGLDINAQICFFPKGAPGPGRDGTWFIAGEDTNQPDPPPGWGIFRLRGERVGKLEAEQVGKLTPTYQAAADNAENYGCGFLSDGRILTTDIGNQAVGDPNGQLIVWFPPFDSRDVEYCKVDVAIGTAGQIYVDDDDRVYVGSARGGGVLRYTGPFPTSNDAAGGCGRTDATGAPLADAVTRDVFIGTENGLGTPNAIVAKADGDGFYVSSVFTGIINEYDADGGFVRTILAPPEGAVLGEQSFATGTPLGLGIDSRGTLYFADIGITVTPEGIGPGPEGSVRRIRFVDGEPRPPEVMGDGLAFPDGIGVLERRK